MTLTIYHVKDILLTQDVKTLPVALFALFSVELEHAQYSTCIFDMQIFDLILQYITYVTCIAFAKTTTTT